MTLTPVACLQRFGRSVVGAEHIDLGRARGERASGGAVDLADRVGEVMTALVPSRARDDGDRAGLPGCRSPARSSRRLTGALAQQGCPYERLGAIGGVGQVEPCSEQRDEPL